MGGGGGVGGRGKGMLSVQQIQKSVLKLYLPFMNVIVFYFLDNLFLALLNGGESYKAVNLLLVLGCKI